MAEAALLEIAGVAAGYGMLPVLRDIDMQVMAGEIIAVLGPNGAGKTTLNKTVSGIIRASAGSIRFADAEITHADPASIVAAGLLHVPEGRKVFPNLAVGENLELGSYRRARANRRRNLERVLAIFPRLAERLYQHAGTLSGGEQQMLAIGRGLMAEPRLLILDEPSLGLSPLLVEEMFTLISRINSEGVTILLVEQNVMQSLAIAHRAYVLEHGVFALSGSAGELLEHPVLKKTYLGM